MHQGRIPMLLLVDDDAEQNVAMVKVLERAGYRVDSAAEAVAMPAGTFPLSKCRSPRGFPIGQRPIPAPPTAGRTTWDMRPR